MGKRRRIEEERHKAMLEPGARVKTVPSFLIPSTALDPTLASLFATSSGPVASPVINRGLESRNAPIATMPDEREYLQDEATSSPRSEPGIADIPESETTDDFATEAALLSSSLDRGNTAHSRKRKRKDESDDIEGAYMRRLEREEASEEKKRLKKRELRDLDSILEDQGDSDVMMTGALAESEDGLLQHESLSTAKDGIGSDKKPRTIFLGNVSTQAIKSKSARKILIKHISKFLKSLPEQNPPHKVESIRFRSTAFDVAAGPKKAAFAKKELMDATTKSTNAYVVYTTEMAARRAIPALNGSVVLDRHLRVDSVAHPSKIDHVRCIFVGNLGFVNEETPKDSEEEGQKRKKAKEPADIEEGLWRTFGQVGTVESVRVIRDKTTRIGKGIAYVQFDDENAVEAALLYNDKKFPPLLPRKLRVSRAKKIRKHPIQPTSGLEGRGQKRVPHRAGPPPRSEGPAVFTKPQRREHAGRNSTSSSRAQGKPGPFVFEGYRASSSDRKPRLKPRKSDKGKPKTRSSRRGAAFKSGGKKKAR